VIPIPPEPPINWLDYADADVNNRAYFYAWGYMRAWRHGHTDTGGLLGNPQNIQWAEEGMRDAHSDMELG
jgi:hypothetical protein